MKLMLLVVVGGGGGGGLGGEREMEEGAFVGGEGASSGVEVPTEALSIRISAREHS